MSNPKKHYTLAEQVDLLQRRGMVITDEALAAETLRTMNYYRFSGYAREFQQDPRNGQNSFQPGVTFESILELAHLDRQLRALLFEALTTIEVHARSSLAYEGGRLYGDGAFYLEAKNYMEITPDLHKHISKLAGDLMRPKQPTVERYRVGDDLSAVPVWVAIEAMTFGAVAKMSWYLNDPELSKSAAQSLGLQTTGFSSGLHTFSVLRNKCAHHSQLWNRTFDVLVAALPKEKKREPKHKSPGPYSTIIVAKRWLNALVGENDWADRVDALLSTNTVYQQGVLNPTMK